MGWGHFICFEKKGVAAAPVRLPLQCYFSVTGADEVKAEGNYAASPGPALGKFRPVKMRVFEQSTIYVFLPTVSLAWNTKASRMPQVVKNHEETEQISRAKELCQAKQALWEALVPVGITQACTSDAVTMRVTGNARPGTSGGKGLQGASKGGGELGWADCAGRVRAGGCHRSLGSDEATTLHPECPSGHAACRTRSSLAP